MNEYDLENNINMNMNSRLKEIWYKYNKYIILSVCIILILIIVIILRKPSDNSRYQDIERIMIINAQNYIKNNNIKDNYYVSLNNLNVKIDDKLKCNNLSGVYKEKDNYYPYLVCENYKSKRIKDVIEENETNKKYGELNGDSLYFVVNDRYQEAGVKTSYQVNIKGNDIGDGLNIVTYYINDNGRNLSELKRIVIGEEVVGSVPVLTLLGEKTRTIPKGSIYSEQGYKAIDEKDGNITDKVKVTGNVDTSKTDTYKLTYSVTNSRGKTASVERTIIVNEGSNIDLNITHKLEPSTTTKKSVTITVTISGNGYKNTVLPDKSESKNKEVSYTVYKNGTYDFLVYDTNNNSEVYSAKVSNIVKEPPSGSCTVTYENNKSSLKINANDKETVSSYEIYNNGTFLIKQKGDSYSFNDYPIETKVKMTDVISQSKTITCKIERKGKIYTKVNYKNFKWTYYQPRTGPAASYYGSTISYAIWAPDEIKDLNGVRLPIMVWLHGSAETYDKVQSADVYLNRGFPKMVSEWKLEPIPAIIIAPQAPSIARCCNNSRVYESIRAMVNYVKDKYNSPTDSIAIMGHSMGGGGALLINDNMKNFFRTVVPLSSGYGIIGSKDTYKNIRIKGYDEDCETAKFFRWMGREEDFTCLKGMEHVEAFEYSVTLDKNKDGVSDLIEWMFEEYYDNYSKNVK